MVKHVSVSFLDGLVQRSRCVQNIRESERKHTRGGEKKGDYPKHNTQTTNIFTKKQALGPKTAPGGEREREKEREKEQKQQKHMLPNTGSAGETMTISSFQLILDPASPLRKNYKHPSNIP